MEQKMYLNVQVLMIEKYEREKISNAVGLSLFY